MYFNLAFLIIYFKKTIFCQRPLQLKKQSWHPYLHQVKMGKITTKSAGV